MDFSKRAQEPTALYAFSADPITFGHINIVERMSACFSRCIVGIGRNPAKQYLFSLDERKNLAKKSLAHLDNVEVMTFEGMVVDFAFEQCAKIIIKGVRSGADMEYEQTLHQVGMSQQLGIDTHILFADPNLAHVSSSVVKGMQLEHGFIQKYVPPAVKAALEGKLSGQLVIGLTGDIAAGKSTLADRLVDAGKRSGVQVHNVDFDVLGHQILSGEGIGEPMYQKLLMSIIDRFGTRLVRDGRVDRAALAEQVFADQDARLFVNELMAKPLAVRLRRALKRKHGIVLLNGALLADLGLLGLCNYRCILCESNLEEQRGRLALRGLDKHQIRERLASQMRSSDKHALILRSIDQAGFGRVWRRGDRDVTDDSSVTELLRSILNHCEEFQCKAQI